GGDASDDADGVEIRRIIQLPPVDFTCTIGSSGGEVCQNVPGAHQAFLMDGIGLSVDGTAIPNVTHFNTLLNTLPSQAPGGNVQVVSPNILNVFVPSNIIASGHGAHRFKLDNSNGRSHFDFTGVISLGHEIVSESFANPGGFTSFDRTVFCPPGKVATGGGLSDSGNINVSGPVGNNGWRVDGTTSSNPYTVSVICVNDF
ncbi:MAG: hypothetical protein VW455_11105, partial [Nitrospinota bacterium]